MKTSFKLFLAVFVFVCMMGGYAVYRHHELMNMPDPYGKLESVENTPEESYDLTDEAKADAAYWVLNAKAGECIYIKCGQTDILVDTGTEKAAKKILEELNGQISGDLDYLFITSLTDRRIGGLEKICKDLKPKKILTCPLGDRKKEIAAAAGAGADIEETGDLTINISKDAAFYAFLPDVSSKDPLDRSLMTYFKYGDTGFFAESDAGEEEEARVVPSVSVCDVVVLARGGSDIVNVHASDLNSSTYIVSNKKNSGVPSAELMDRLRGSFFATYQSGTIKFTTNGKTVESNLKSDDRLKEAK